MDKKRFYINTRGNDDEAYREAMQFACQLSEDDPDIKRVVLLAHTKSNTGWLERLYDRETVKKLFNGVKFKDCIPTFVIKTKKTYSDPHQLQDIVITMGLDTEDVMKIDDFYGVKAIIAIPWLPERLEDWVQTWAPIDIRTQEQPETYPLPNPIVQEAMKELTSSVNMTTGIHHPSDERQAKTYIRALYKYVDDLDGDVIAAYMVRELGWDTDHAKDVKKLIDTLNDGRYFQGGEKTHLKSHINRWKEKLE